MVQAWVKTISCGAARDKKRVPGNQLPRTKGHQLRRQKMHKLGYGTCRCQAVTPRAPVVPPRTVPKRQEFTAADTATRSMQHSNWRARYGVVLAPPSRNNSLPQVCAGNAVVMVEGLNDAVVVREAVNAPVLIMGGTNSAKSAGGLARLQQVSEAVGCIVVVADPDAEGTRFRTWVVQQPGQHNLLHAFMPLSRAVLSSMGKYHQLGNAGIEHAHPRDVARAILSAKPRDCTRSEFCREDLEEWELVNGWEGASVQHAAFRREILCNALGVGRMDGTKLVKVLNSYHFSHEQVIKAVEFSNRRLEKLLPLLEAVKVLRRVNGQDALVDEMARPIDAFVYGLQKKVALAVAQDIIKRDQAGKYVRTFLEQSGWALTPEFRGAVDQLFETS